MDMRANNLYCSLRNMDITVLRRRLKCLGLEVKLSGVPVDEHGRTIPSELEVLLIKARETGFMPFYVNATAGTTVLGSFDPLNEIADVCERQKLWLHIDGRMVVRSSFRID
jgi:glutamate/tyrosine decarboxylase-like PLP-dependent enzyme